MLLDCLIVVTWCSSCGKAGTVTLCAHIIQDVRGFNFSWSCVGMKSHRTSGAKNCMDATGAPIRFPVETATTLHDTSEFKFVPYELNLQLGKIYVFDVTVRTKIESCYSEARLASANISVQIAPKQHDNPPKLKVVVCRSYPCECEDGLEGVANFNPGSKAVLRACSPDWARTHDWTAMSSAALIGSEFTSPTGYGKSAQLSVTVLMGPPISDNILEP